MLNRFGTWWTTWQAAGRREIVTGCLHTVHTTAIDELTMTILFVQATTRRCDWQFGFWQGMLFVLASNQMKNLMKRCCVQRTAARLVTQALSLVDDTIASEMEEDYESFGTSKPAECDELEQLLVAQLGVLDNGHNKAAKSKVVHYRIAEDLDDDQLKDLNTKMEQHTEDGDVCIISGEESIVNDVLPKIVSFRRRAPHKISLRDLTVEELAEVVLCLVDRAGYSVRKDADMPVKIRSKQDLMTLIVTQVNRLEHDTEWIRQSCRVCDKGHGCVSA